LIQEKQTEEKVRPSDKKISPKDLAHFAMLSRGNCWLSVEGIPERAVVIAFCWPGGLQLFCALAREHVQGQPSAKSRLKPTVMSRIMEGVARRRQSSVGP
jgi:hypothetical protein